jgi:hypothetical protein
MLAETLLNPRFCLSFNSKRDSIETCCYLGTRTDKITHSWTGMDQFYLIFNARPLYLGEILFRSWRCTTSPAARQILQRAPPKNISTAILGRLTKLRIQDSESFLAQLFCINFLSQVLNLLKIFSGCRSTSCDSVVAFYLPLFYQLILFRLTVVALTRVPR